LNGDDRFRILVLGYGEMGHAMEHLLAARHRVRIWQRHPPADTPPLSLEQVVPDSDFIVFCLPATAHPEVSARIASPLAQSDALCLTIAKGLDQQSRLPAEVLGDTCGSARVAVLYGPMISEEIMAGKPAFAQCGASTAPVSQRVADLFSSSSLMVETAQDLIGLSWSAILKNVYALVFGMADALRLGDNVRGFLAAAALHELSTMVQLQGGRTETPYRLAGLGDLITTATSAGSHHHELGGSVARGDYSALTGEGIHTLAMLRARPRFDAGQFPLYTLIDECVHTPQDVRVRLDAFLKIPYSSP
jgi:glycerol-3-phosphate dehydrogenase (NAD(P)+)